MPSTLCRASHLWSFWRLTPKRSASSVIVYRPLRYNSMKRVRSFTGPVTSQGITRPPFRGTSVTHVPGLFCHLCARSVPSQKLSRPGAGPAAELPSQHTRITASRRLQIARRGSATPPRPPPWRRGFGTWALAVQLRLKPLGWRQTSRQSRLYALRADGSPSRPEHTQSFSPQSLGTPLILTRAVHAAAFCHESAFIVLAPPEHFGAMSDRTSVASRHGPFAREHYHRHHSALRPTAHMHVGLHFRLRETVRSPKVAPHSSHLENTCVCYHTVLRPQSLRLSGSYDVVGIAFCREEGCKSEASARLNACAAAQD